MTFLLSASCFLIAFTPAAVVFKELIAKDPLRVILFVLAAFFWLVALLASALVWLVSFKSLLPALFISVVCQEAARGLYYFLLHRAQNGLAKLASNGVEVTGIRLLYSSRHILAVVSGLGFGVMASLFLLLNIIADSAHDGIVGLPASLHSSSAVSDMVRRINGDDGLEIGADRASFPLFYSISCALLVLFHLCWAVALWDGLHKRVNGSTARQWSAPVAAAITSHLINSTLSLWLGPHPLVVLPLQGALLTFCAAYSYSLIRNIPLTNIIPTRSGGGDAGRNSHATNEPGDLNSERL